MPLSATGKGVGPIGVAAASPIGEVVFGKRTSAEFFGEDALDFRQGVEPGEQFRSRGAVFEAVIQLIADEFRQASNFAGTGFHGMRFLTTDGHG